jgi:ABC-type transporter Mla MlaB component
MHGPMASVVVTPMRESKFEADAEVQPPLLLARMAGTADITSQEHLARFLDQIDDAARTAGVSAVRVDLSGVEFLNSTCMGAFAGWFARVAPSGRAAYEVTLVFRSTGHRPRRSFGGMLNVFPFVRLDP